jgi:hypothetical protein
MATTTNYGWSTPDDTSLVKDGASAIRTLGSSIDTTVFTNASAAIPKTIVDAKGDLIAATASDTVSRLAVGTNGHVLTADSAEATGIKWASVVGGSMTLLSTTTLSGSSVVISSISSAYRNLYLVINNFRPNNDSETVRVRVNGDSGARYRNDAIAGATGAFSDTFWNWSGASDNGASTSFMQMTMFDYATSGIWKTGLGYSWTNNQTTPANSNFQSTAFAYNQTGAISSITLYVNAATFTSGTALLYGVN